MRDGEISTRYLESIKDTLGKFAGKYGDASIASLSGIGIKGWLADLPVVPKSRQRHFSTLRTAFNIAYWEWKVIAANPFEGLNGFRVKRKDKIEILTPEELRKFLISRSRLPPFLRHLRFYRPEASRSGEARLDGSQIGPWLD
jgi:hypothetical protein